MDELLQGNSDIPRSSDSKDFRCPLCPWRCFNRPYRTLDHVREYHSSRVQYVCSGTKQLKVITILWDFDARKRGTVRKSYLRRSAELLRESVLPGLSGSTNEIDRYVRLVFTQNGPEYVNVDSLIKKEDSYRRVRNLYYNKGFAEILRSEILMCNAKVRSLQTRLYFRALEAGNQMAGLYPKKLHSWWPLIEDVFFSDAAKDLVTSLLQELVRHQEYESLSIDATMRACLSITGQTHPRKGPAENAFAREDCLRRLITIVGRTGAG